MQATFRSASESPPTQTTSFSSTLVHARGVLMGKQRFVEGVSSNNTPGSEAIVKSTFRGAAEDDEHAAGRGSETHVEPRGGGGAVGGQRSPGARGQIVAAEVVQGEPPRASAKCACSFSAERWRSW